MFRNYRRPDPDEEPPKPQPRRRPRRVRPVEAPNHERWLVSYADFITLLFAMFTTMYALSVVDAEKYSAMAASMQEAFKSGGLAEVGTEGATVLVPRPADAKVGFLPAAGREIGLADVQSRLETRLAPVLDSKFVSIERDPRGLVVSLREAGSFAQSSADLSPAARVILEEIGGALLDVGNHVRIEGHTDDVPIHTDRYASNWELSTARATTVIRFLLAQSGIHAGRLSAAGYAEYFPRVPNSSVEGRARNRRVDLVILSPQVRAAEEPVRPAAGASSP